MAGRSDLIIEGNGLNAGKISVPGKENEGMPGVRVEEEWNGRETVKTTTVTILTEEGARAMERPVGRYITMEIPQLREEENEILEEAETELAKQLKHLLHGKHAEHILVIGLGNREVTADAVGPMTVDKITVTRQIFAEGKEDTREEKEARKRMQKKYRKISALVPGVMAQTGMETMEIIHGIVKEIQPDVVLAVDALAARSPKRLNTTIQLTDTGICPGAGVGNNRRELSEATVGRPVLAIGVPTVLDAVTIAREEEAEDFAHLFVMSRTVDSSVQFISELLADGINKIGRR